MIKNLDEFGIDAQTILDFSDFDALEEIHNAIDKYRKTKNDSHVDESVW